ncbi:hypothetical protein R3P38DRAFT_3362841 [Favolaschia claudopus]|uniref:Uncharacterized protein n=1 Tax=Favolaschia claudopus TaxID=2862362 RepID=A0AAW0AKL8_9AGAR
MPKHGHMITFVSQAVNFAQARPEETGNRTRQYNQDASPARPPDDRRTTCDELFVAARKDYLDPPSRHDLGYMNDRCPTCGALHWVAEQVPPKNSRSPYGMCCNHGKVALQRLEEPPEPLHRFFVGNDAQAVDNISSRRIRAKPQETQARCIKWAGRVKTGVKGLPPVVAQGVPVTDTKRTLLQSLDRATRPSHRKVNIGVANSDVLAVKMIHGKARNFGFFVAERSRYGDSDDPRCPPHDIGIFPRLAGFLVSADFGPPADQNINIGSLIKSVEDYVRIRHTSVIRLDPARSGQLLTWYRSTSAFSLPFLSNQVVLDSSPNPQKKWQKKNKKCHYT